MNTSDLTYEDYKRLQKKIELQDRVIGIIIDLIICTTVFLIGYTLGAIYG